MRKRVALFVTLIALTGGCAQGSQAQASKTVVNVLVPRKGVGKPYGSRDPMACSSKVAPKKGPISAAQAAQYVQCADEKLDSDGYLFLNEHLKVTQVAKGRPFSGAGLYGGGDVDPNTMVYAIRGSFDNYLCGKVMHGSVLENTGKNCALWHETHATGYCLRTNFGDWSCTMSDLDAQQVPGQPPPTS